MNGFQPKCFNEVSDWTTSWSAIIPALSPKKDNST